MDGCVGERGVRGTLRRRRQGGGSRVNVRGDLRPRILTRALLQRRADPPTRPFLQNQFSSLAYAHPFLDPPSPLCGGPPCRSFLFIPQRTGKHASRCIPLPGPACLVEHAHLEITFYALLWYSTVCAHTCVWYMYRLCLCAHMRSVHVRAALTSCLDCQLIISISGLF